MATIAIFDSGIGGITFLALARRCLPNERYIYYADTDHVPYGTKTTTEVRHWVGIAVDFLCSQAIDILVVACNTATSAACQALRATHAFPILGMEPALKPALESAKPKKVLLFSTSLTMREDKLRNLMHTLDAADQVDTVALDGLVRTAEQFDFESPTVRRIITEALAQHPLTHYGAVVLGCTHFIHYKHLVRQMLPHHIRVLDGNQGTLDNLVRVLGARQLTSATAGGPVAFYSSGRPDPPERVEQLITLMHTTSNQEEEHSCAH